MRTRFVAAVGTAVAVVLVAGFATGSVGAKAPPPPFRIGFAKMAIDPDPADVAAGTVHLGGYGLLPTRATTGPMRFPDGSPEHLWVRAMAIRNASGGSLLLADIDSQGTFAAYKQCACGLYDVRAAVAKSRGIPIENIVVNSDHSHSGPDLIGLWGGVPVRYLQLVHDQAVRALEAAYDRAQPARLLAGSAVPTMPTPDQGGYVPDTATPGEPLVHSQFDANPSTGHDDHLVDTELRVLQAVTPAGKRLGTLVNYAAHADVTGSDNVGYSADWPGWTSTKVEKALGEPVAVTMVADVGRSQPPRPNSDPLCGKPGHLGCDADKLDTYSRILLGFVKQAVAGARPVTDPTIANHEVFTREAATNPALLGASLSGEVPVTGYGASRGSTPPWVTGDVIGSFVSAHRVGDLLLTAAPGEAYPDVRFAVQRSVTGYRSAFTFGLANDQLGYLIAPASEYQWIATSNLGNDNALFNVSVTYGDHVYCSQTSAAVAIGFRATNVAKPYGPAANAPVCPPYAVADELPMGPVVQQPWPFGNGIPGPPLPIGM